MWPQPGHPGPAPTAPSPWPGPSRRRGRSRGRSRAPLQLPGRSRGRSRAPLRGRRRLQLPGRSRGRSRAPLLQMLSSRWSSGIERTVLNSSYYECHRFDAVHDRLVFSGHVFEIHSMNYESVRSGSGVLFHFAVGARGQPAGHAPFAVGARGQPAGYAPFELVVVSWLGWGRTLKKTKSCQSDVFI